MKNVGTIDRVFRLILGIALIAVALGAGLPFFADPIFMYGAVAVGGVLILTALVRICPLYSLLGIRT